MRLGDLDALKEVFDITFFNDADDYKRALRIIDNAPTVVIDEEIERQREELYQSSKKLFDTARMLGAVRPQGEWEKPFLHNDGIYYHKCNMCHICSEVSILQEKYCNFCPNCGARMMRREEK